MGRESSRTDTPDSRYRSDGVSRGWKNHPAQPPLIRSFGTAIRRYRQ